MNARGSHASTIAAATSTVPAIPYARARPRGLLRLLLKVPPLLYRVGLANRLGPRFLLLTTTGRRSGRLRTVALDYATDGETVYVMSGFGHTDWLRNLMAQPEVEVAIGRDRWCGVALSVVDPVQMRRARRLFRQQAGRRGPPRVLRGPLRRVGFDYEAELSVLDRPDLDLPIVAIRRASRG